MGRDHAITCEHCGTEYSGFDGPDECPSCEGAQGLDRYTSLARRFNRLESAVAEHRLYTPPPHSAADDELYEVHRQVLKDAAGARGGKVDT